MSQIGFKFIAALLSVLLGVLSAVAIGRRLITNPTAPQSPVTTAIIAAVVVLAKDVGGLLVDAAQAYLGRRSLRRLLRKIKDDVERGSAVRIPIPELKLASERFAARYTASVEITAAVSRLQQRLERCQRELEPDGASVTFDRLTPTMKASARVALTEIDVAMNTSEKRGEN